MSKEVDTDKVVRQHLEMEGFFTGYVIRGAMAKRIRRATPPRAAGEAFRRGRQFQRGRGSWR
jgi:hypothetical protein